MKLTILLRHDPTNIMTQYPDEYIVDDGVLTLAWVDSDLQYTHSIDIPLDRIAVVRCNWKEKSQPYKENKHG